MPPMTPPAILDSTPPSPPLPAFEHVPLCNGDLRMIYRASKFRGSLNWLNKLRAAKGFPVDGDRGVDDLLSSQESCLEQDGANNDVINRSAFVLESESASRVAEISPCQASGFIIPSTILCRNGGADVESDGNRRLSADPLCRVNTSPPTIAAKDCNSPLQGPQLSLCIAKDEGSRESMQSLDPSAQDVAQLYAKMFAELFCMESCTVDLTQKRHRKQVKPKNCSNSLHDQMPCFTLQAAEHDTSTTHGNHSGDPPTLISVVNDAKPHLPSSPPEIEASGRTVYQKKTVPKKNAIDISRNNLDDEVTVLKKADRNSGNEILVIDTSLQGWRIEKLIAKKRNSWKIQDKLMTPHEHSNSDCSTKTQLKRKLESSNSIVPKAVAEVQKQCESSTCKEKGSKDEMPQSASIPLNRPSESQKRSRRKRRKNALREDEPLKVLSGSITRKDGFFENMTILAADHPANQPKEGLIYSIYQVFMQAGKAGLTAREAVSRILEQGLPGLQEGGVAPRVEVLKIVSNSPYFMSLEESKYILCGALVGDEGDSSGRKKIIPEVSQNGEGNQNDLKSVKQHGISQYWPAYAAIRRARTGIIRRRPFCGPFFRNHVADQNVHQVIGNLSHKKCLKLLKQDVTGLGNRCNRTDGKGWHCPLRAKVGYLLCDHHLDRLRSRVKLHTKSNLILNGSWVVKKGYRSREDMH